MPERKIRPRSEIDDSMSSNVGIEYFPGCKGCVFAEADNKFTPGYTKSVCFVHKKLKPMNLMNGGRCEYYDEAETDE